MRAIVALCLLAHMCAGQYYHGEASHAHLRERRQHGQQAHQAPQINYRPLSHAPANIKQLLASQQAREPLVNIPVGKPPQLGPAPGHGGPAQNHAQPTQAQIAQYRPHVQYGSAPQQPTYNNIKPQPIGPPQQPAHPQYQPGPQQQQGGQQPNYKALYRPIQGPVHQEPQIQYSKQLPPHLQQLLKQHYPQ